MGSTSRSSISTEANNKNALHRVSKLPLCPYYTSILITAPLVTKMLHVVREPTVTDKPRLNRVLNWKNI